MSQRIFISWIVWNKVFKIKEKEQKVSDNNWATRFRSENHRIDGTWGIKGINAVKRRIKRVKTIKSGGQKKEEEGVNKIRKSQ